MPIVRLKEFPELQQALIKSMFKQIKNKCNDGQWRDFKADITISGKRFNFECAFKYDGFFLSIGKKVVRDGANQVIAPETGIYIPVQ